MAKIKNKKPKKQNYLGAVLSLGKLTVLISILTTIFFTYYFDRIYPGVYIDGINLTGKSAVEASHLLVSKVNTPESIILNFNNQSFFIPTNSLNINYDFDK